MRAVLQRVTEASVTVDGQVIGEIDKGIMVLFGPREKSMTNLDSILKSRDITLLTRSV